tara:strand:+ start:930 stop:1832 length:903 start_codon:yes stop_codon:yes gene_type:complete
MKNNYHKPVLLTESIVGLNIKKDGIYVDVTFGGGGHSKEILENLSENGRLISFDQDPDAIANVFEDKRFCFINENFEYMKNFLKNIGITKVSGILADLGISSYQINEPKRGFSYRYDSKLDMRMDKNNSTDAFQVINNYTEENLSDILYEFGDLNNSKKISQHICTKRKEKKINTTFDFNSILKPLFPERYLNKNLSRIYQAIRIEVNNEIGVLKSFLEQSSQLLISGGRLGVISYHSIEDRLVKRFIKNGSFSSDIEKDFYGNFSVPLKKVGSLITPSQEEIRINKRSRSAKLRLAQKN